MNFFEILPSFALWIWNTMAKEDLIQALKPMRDQKHSCIQGRLSVSIKTKSFQEFKQFVVKNYKPKTVDKVEQDILKKINEAKASAKCSMGEERHMWNIQVGTHETSLERHLNERRKREIKIDAEKRVVSHENLELRKKRMKIKLF